MEEVTEQEKHTASSEEINLDNMTREEALGYMGLSSDADIKEIDDRFWQMSKKYRGRKDPESEKMEDEISAVYDIASGRRDRKVKEEQEWEAEPKYWGKTKAEWKNYVEYTWYKYVAVIGGSIALIVILVGYFFNSQSSYVVAVFGHMHLDNSFMIEALLDNGADKPYVGYADVIVPNDEDLVYSETGNETLNALFYMNPAILISDHESYTYYFSTYKDLAPVSDRIMAGLTEEARAGITPVYMTEQDAVFYQNEMYRVNGFGDDVLEDPSGFSDTPVLIGYEITDPELTAKLGVDCYWESRQTTLIFCECANCEDDDTAVMMITTLINYAFA